MMKGRRPSQEIGHVTIQISQKIDSQMSSGKDKSFKQKTGKKKLGTSGLAVRDKQADLDVSVTETVNEVQTTDHDNRQSDGHSCRGLPSGWPN